MLPALDLNSIAQFSASRIFDSLIGGTLIAILAAVLLRLSRRQTSSTRFAVWLCALSAIASLGVAGTGWLLHSKASGAATGSAILTVSANWALYLFLGWAAIAFFGLARVCSGVLQIYRLHRSCTPVEIDKLDPEVRQSLHSASRRVTLCTSEYVTAPTALGLMKPVIAIPAWLIDELSGSELNHIVIHEAAHLERRDDWTNLFQKIVKAVLFFHPAVWWIESKMSLEREMACDEAVLARTSNPRVYAQCLARLAETTFVRRSLELAQAVLGRAHQLSSRVAKILDSNHCASIPAWKPVSLVAAVAVGSLICVSEAPQLIAFKDAPQPSAMAQSYVPVNLVTNASWHPVENVRASKPVETPRAAQARSSSLPVQPRYVAKRSPAVSENPVHLAAARMNANPAPAAMLVVVQTFAYGSHGQAVFQTTVWRISLPPMPNQTQSPSLNQISRKQT
jgi:beta-lactamase regulating signal transducer with metallopeptidase domain